MFLLMRSLRDTIVSVEHRDLHVARLKILRYAFVVFGWMATLSCLSSAVGYLLIDKSSATPLQIGIYALVAVFCFWAKPKRLIWAFFAALGPLGMGIAASIENSLIFVFVGMFFSVFGIAIFFGALRGMLYLVSIYAVLMVVVTQGAIVASSAELGRLPAYFLACACMVLCLGVLLRSLSDSFSQRDQKEMELAEVNHRLNASLVQEKAALAQQSEALHDLKRVEEELNASIETLRQARYDLEEKTLKQQEIFAIIGHELRAPAAGIELIANDRDNYIANQPLLEQSSKQLLRVLDDMRQIVQPELQHPISIEFTLLPDMMESISIQMRAMLEKAQIELTTELGASPIDLTTTPIPIDQFRVETLLTNLIRNACLHSGGQHIKVVFNAVQDRLQITVQDDGRGIPNDADVDLFAPWVRGDSTASGTGLGLSIVKRAVTELDGQVQFTSSPLGGAAIQVQLPLDHSATARPPLTQATDLTELNIVVVDDDEILGILIERQFAKLFKTFKLYDNPETALTEVMLNPPDVLITDNYMPQMTGVTLITRLRALGFNRPIIGATGAVLYQGEHPMLEAGANELIIKPMTPDNLTQAVKSIFQWPNDRLR